MEKIVKVFKNDNFCTYRTTAVLVSERMTFSSVWDNILTVYSHKNTLIELITENRYLNELMNEHGFEIEKDWNRGDFIKIKIYMHSFNAPVDLGIDENDIF
jgi:hypothetical protein